MKGARTFLKAVLVAVCILVSINFLNAPIARLWLTSLYDLSPNLALKGGSLISALLFSQCGLLILVFKLNTGGYKSLLLGVIAGFLILPIAGVKELDSILKEAIEQRDYKVYQKNEETSTLSLPFRHGTGEVLLPSNLLSSLEKKYPPKNK
jgi:hypothetical protein